MAPRFCRRKVGDRVFLTTFETSTQGSRPAATIHDDSCMSRENPQNAYRDIAAKMLDNVNNVK